MTLFMCAMPVLVFGSFQWYASQILGEFQKSDSNTAASTNLGVIFALTVILVCANALFPIRSCILWPAFAAPIILQLGCIFVLDSPNTLQEDLVQSAFLLLISIFLGYCRWQYEFQARLLFAAQADAKFPLGQNSQKQVVEALEVVLRHPVEVMFRAGPQLKVVGSYRKLEELIGPMNGLFLDQRTGRYNRMV